MDLILFDRSPRRLGPAGAETRSALGAYLQEAAARPALDDDPTGGPSSHTGEKLQAVGDALDANVPTDPTREALNDTRDKYRHLVEQRWTIVEQSEGVLPRPLIALLVLWFMLSFASFA